MSGDQCVFDRVQSHPYSYCVKPVEDMIGDTEPNPTGFDKTTKVISGLYNYTSELFIGRGNAISDDCGNKIGNKYVLKTSVKCKNGEPRYKYIDNSCELSIKVSIKMHQTFPKKR